MEHKIILLFIVFFGSLGLARAAGRLAVAAPPAEGQVQGQVVDEDGAVAGARVRVRAKLR
jgi:hypothetical protein